MPAEPDLARPVARDLEGEIDPLGRLLRANDALAGILDLAPADAIGRALDDHAIGAGRRSLARAAADASAGLGPVGPVDLWIGHDVTRTVVCRLWVERVPGDEERYVITGHDLARLDDDHRFRALEALLLERVATGDPLTSVLRSLAQLVEWQVPGGRCTIGVTEEDGLVRHRSSDRVPSAVTEVFDAMQPGEPLAAAGRNSAGLVVVDEPGDSDERLAAALEGMDVGSLWMMRIDREGAGEVGGLLAVLVPPDVRPDGATLTVLRAVTHIAATAIGRDAAEERLLHQAMHDPLTGLPNRVLLHDRIAQALSRVRFERRRVAVLMLDLDHFKVVNDSMSHVAGDRVLQRAAERLVQVSAEGETVGRFGGDEFLVVTEVESHDAGARRAEQFREALDDSVVVGGVTIKSSVSIGLVVAGPLSDARSLLRDADAALHRAKADGRNCVAVFDQSMRESVLARVELETALRVGIAESELEVHYQPIVDVERDVPCGVEALVRWRRGPGQLVSPGDFVPLAEDVGLIDDLGMDVLEQSCAVVAGLRRDGWSDLTVAVNVSARQLGGALVDRVSSVLANVGLDPTALVLEITEGVLTRSGADAVVRAIDRLGVGIAIDDFGTGYSSLEYLRRFPVAGSLKIDGSFVADLQGPGPTGQAIVAAAVVLGHSLDMYVVAEGVETPGQLQLLRELGCDRAQGYLIGRPATAAQLPDALAQVVPRAESG